MSSHPPLDPRATALLIYHFTEHHTRPGSPGFEQAMVDGLPEVQRLLAQCRKAGEVVMRFIR